MVLIYASYLLVRRSRKFNRRTIRDRFKNRYIILKYDKITTLIPLSQKQMYIDQLKLKKEI